MSAGPNRVAPVSRPETVITAESMWCSMKGRASVMQILTHTPACTVLSAHSANSAPVGLALRAAKPSAPAAVACFWAASLMSFGVVLPSNFLSWAGLTEGSVMQVEYSASSKVTCASLSASSS